MLRNWFSLMLIAVWFMVGCEFSPDENDFYLSWNVDRNMDGRFESTLTFHNESEQTLAGDWKLWFNLMRMIDVGTIPSEVELTHINGSFYKLEPADEFTPLEPGEAYRFSFESLGPAILESDAPVGAYFEFPGENIVPVSRIEVGEFEEKEQLMRGSADEVPVSTPERTYQKNEDLETLPADDVGRITPSPAEKQRMDGEFEISGQTVIHYQSGLENEAHFLSRAWEPVLDETLSVEEGIPEQESGVVILRKSQEVPELQNTEAYKLEVSDEQIQLTGSDAAGVFYGIQSLRKLIPPKKWQDSGRVSVGAIEIRDAPGFEYRGLHLDVARNFFDAETVKKLLDVMAFYNLNRFHFHLTDDEGWRLESGQFPELTEIGGRRGHTVEENEFLIPSFGSGPYPDDPKGSGWYSREEYKDILKYARERHIEVIPEIDIPGHARAAKVAMRNRYERLIEEGRQEEAERYRIHDPEDESEYLSVQRFDDNVINVCQESTYRFLDVIFDEIKELHQSAGVPLSMLHVGGDEVPSGAWEDSPVCAELIRESDQVDSVDDLMDYTFHRVEKLLTDHDLTMAAWEEFSLIGDPQNGDVIPNPEFSGRSIPYVWSNIWGTGRAAYSYQLANAGYEIVMSHASNFYFDLAYTKHPEEAGLYWAGFVDTSDPYAFIPYDLYKSGKTDWMGRPIPEDAYEGKEQLTEDGRENILGLQGQLWGETLREDNRLEYMALPRLVSLAERAWNPEEEWMDQGDRSRRNAAKREAWNEFANRLGQRELPRLDDLNGGYAYRLPPPGAVVEDGVLHANVSYPGLAIRFTTDGSEPGPESEQFDQPVELSGDEEIRLRSFDSNGRGSRTVQVSNP